MTSASACLFLAGALGAGFVSADGEVALPAQCSLNYAAAVPCRMTDTVGPDGTHRMEFALGERRVRFAGRSQTGWWSGQLDGQPAMGHELNRGHAVFSTQDLKTTFEWWSEGHEHGSY